MNLDETRKAKLTILTALYYSRPRTDSLPRFIRRLKPQNMRYQSLLRGAFKAKREEAIKKGIDQFIVRENAADAQRDMIEYGLGVMKAPA